MGAILAPHDFMPFLKKRGKKWYLYWKEKVGGEWKTFAKPDSPDYEVAKLNLADFAQRLARKGSGLTVRCEWDEFKKSFLNGHQEGRTKTLYEYTFRRFQEYVNPVAVSDVTYQKAKEWRDWLLRAKSLKTEKPLSPTTINIDIRNMRAAWAEAKRLGYATENIFAMLKEAPHTSPLPRYLTANEVKRLIREAKIAETDDAYPMLTFFLYAGLRLQEVLNLKWSSVDLNRKVLYLRESPEWEPKDRAENSIPLHEAIQKALKNRKRTGDLIFPGNDGGVRDSGAVIRLFNKLYGRAHIRASGCHILRHTWATHASIPAKVKQKILGHSDPKTTQRYDHVTPEDLEAIRQVKY